MGRKFLSTTDRERRETEQSGPWTEARQKTEIQQTTEAAFDSARFRLKPQTVFGAFAVSYRSGFSVVLGGAAIGAFFGIDEPLNNSMKRIAVGEKTLCCL